MQQLRGVAPVVLLLMLLAGCGSGATSREATQNAEQQAQVTELKERIKSLEAEVVALKEAPQELLRKSVEAREKNDFEQSTKLLDELEDKYPASPEASKVPVERDLLKQAFLAKQEADRKGYDDAVARAKGEATPEKSKAVLEAYIAGNPASVFKAKAEATIAAYTEQIRIAEEESKKPPVELVSTEMGHNSIGTPTMEIAIRNLSSKVVDGFEFAVDLYDNYDRAVYHYRIQSDGNSYYGIAQHKVQPGGTEDWSWTMYGFDLATKYKNLRVRSVHFTDGTEWRP